MYKDTFDKGEMTAFRFQRATLLTIWLSLIPFFMLKERSRTTL